MMKRNLPRIILKAVALGVGVSTAVLSIMGNIEVSNAIMLLSIGLVCLAILNLQEK